MSSPLQPYEAVALTTPVDQLHVVVHTLGAATPRTSDNHRTIFLNTPDGSAIRINMTAKDTESTEGLLKWDRLSYQQSASQIRNAISDSIASTPPLIQTTSSSSTASAAPSAAPTTSGSPNKYDQLIETEINASPQQNITTPRVSEVINYINSTGRGRWTNLVEEAGSVVFFSNEEWAEAEQLTAHISSKQ
ncbi:hypothetical protein L228DRAFT_266279 [Xylona heveae TC161]|uniref:DUF7770 domain-containing protein n=1 Tax=Xylona heveae (strain CBS 132557 / TC161) TaxID=1328760 RepID=A0A165J7A1_XYLHT|nr:hypothetical protein L228DRAFT_266279 [Xylona heveae TC161]KZF25836.1 hypothetical protein L228DRAFT_266279 [Xylona heveae TC161]